MARRSHRDSIPPALGKAAGGERSQEDRLYDRKREVPGPGGGRQARGTLTLLLCPTCKMSRCLHRLHAVPGDPSTPVRADLCTRGHASRACQYQQPAVPHKGRRLQGPEALGTPLSAPAYECFTVHIRAAGSQLAVPASTPCIWWGKQPPNRGGWCWASTGRRGLASPVLGC